MEKTTPQAAIFRSSAVEGKSFGAIKVTELLTKEHSSQMSVALIEVSGENDVVINTECDAAYYVLNGEGAFSIDEGEGLEAHSVQKGDIIFIPQGTAYQDSGEMTLLALNSPAFDREQQEQIVQEVDESADEFPTNDALVEELLTTKKAEELMGDSRIPSILERNEKERQRWPDFVLVIPPEGTQPDDSYEIGGEIGGFWKIINTPISVVITFKSPDGKDRGNADIFEITEEQAKELKEVFADANTVVYGDGEN